MQYKLALSSTRKDINYLQHPCRYMIIFPQQTEQGKGWYAMHCWLWWISLKHFQPSWHLTDHNNSILCVLKYSSMSWSVPNDNTYYTKVGFMSFLSHVMLHLIWENLKYIFAFHTIDWYWNAVACFNPFPRKGSCHFRNQGISSNGNDLVILQYSGFTTRRFNQSIWTRYSCFSQNGKWNFLKIQAWHSKRHMNTYIKELWVIFH